MILSHSPTNITAGVNGASRARALQHNKEMHASNGNIDFCTEETETMTDLLRRIQLDTWNRNVIEVEERVELEPVLNESESLFQRSSYNDAYGPGSSYPGVMGTLHTHLKYDWQKAMNDREEFDTLAKSGNLRCLKLCKQTKGAPVPKEGSAPDPLDNFGERAANRVRSWAAVNEVMGVWAMGHLMASAYCECIVIALIEQFFLANFNKEGLITVGGGEGRIERILAYRLGTDLAKDLRWVGVGQLRNCNHGKLAPNVGQRIRKRIIYI